MLKALGYSEDNLDDSFLVPLKDCEDCCNAACQEAGSHALEMIQDALVDLWMHTPPIPNQIPSDLPYSTVTVEIGADCGTCSGRFDASSYRHVLHRDLWLSQGAFQTGSSMTSSHEWSGPIKLNPLKGALDQIQGVDIDSFGRLFYKYYGLIRRGLKTKGFVLNMAGRPAIAKYAKGLRRGDPHYDDIVMTIELCLSET